jgi:branched-subunit amino acid transport protein
VTEFVAILIIGTGTYLTRLSFIALVGDRQMPAWALGPLRYVAPAVLAAIIAPAVMVVDGSVALTPATNPRFLAAVVAGLVAWRFRNVVAVIVSGMGTLWILQALV